MSKITEKIKSYEDALKVTGRPTFHQLLNISVSEVNDNEDGEENVLVYLENQYKAVVIAEALNEGWKPDWKNASEQKWFPYFRVSSSGFAFCGSVCVSVTPSAGGASRICFKTGELAEYAGEQFLKIWEKIITK
jgi:hypothetical protein